jgi:hypothetical protein
VGQFNQALPGHSCRAPKAGQAVANLAQGIGASELAKKHGYELRPAAKSLGGAFGTVFLNQGGELGTGEMLEQLIEKAGSLYDCLGPPCGRRSAKLPVRNDSPTLNYRRALYPCSSELVLDKSAPKTNTQMFVWLWQTDFPVRIFAGAKPACT